MKVKELMKTRSLVSVHLDDTLAEAAHIMRWAAVRHLPVLDGDRVVGVLTERDLLRYRAETGGTGAERVRGYMSAPPEVISPEEEVAAACALMVARKIGCLPVVEGDGLVGIITKSDVIGSQLAAYVETSLRGGPRIEVAMKRDPASVLPYTPLLEAVGIMVDRGVRHVPVTDEDGRLVGIISDRDVRTAIGDPVDALHQELEELEEMKVSGVMTTNVITARENTPLFEVAERFVQERIGAMPVLDDTGRLVGIVSYVDVIQALLEQTADRRAEVPEAALHGADGLPVSASA